MLKTGIKNEDLADEITGKRYSKNQNIKIFELLDINSVMLEDNKGDEVVLNVQIGTNDVKLMSGKNEIGSKDVSEKGTLFKINCKEYAEVFNKNFGNLRDIEIEMKDNDIKR